MNPIIPTNKNKRSRHIANWLARFAERAVNWVFARDDQTARDGWEVISRPGSLVRRYRDQRFDTLSACPECEGNGYALGEPCGACQATGVIRRLPAPGEVIAGDDDALAATA
jgi:hypothetical protein